MVKPENFKLKQKKRERTRHAQIEKYSFRCMASNGCGTHAVKLTSLHMGSLHLCRSPNKHTHTEYRSEDQCSALIYVI